MKKNLVKMTLSMGFGCKPVMTSVRYVDDVIGQETYKDKDNRNQKLSVRIGEIWAEYDENNDAPYWKAYAIVEENDDALMEKSAKDMYAAIIYLVKISKDKFVQSVENLSIPEKFDFKFSELQEAKMFSKHHDEFADAIHKKMESVFRTFADSKSIEETAWSEFFSSTVTIDIVKLLLKGIQVLKKSGDYYEFSNEEAYLSTINAIATKIASDAFAKYCEIK